MAETEEQSAASKPKKRILLVFDNQEIVEALRYALESRGYGDPGSPRRATQGLVMAEQEVPDIGDSGHDDAQTQRFSGLGTAGGHSTQVPMRVIMITANEGSRHKAYAEMLGVDDYIRKPFAMDRLVDSVQRLLA